MTDGYAPVVDRMRRQVESWEGEGDPRSVFLACYSMMTDNMLRALEQGRFRDRAWVGELLHLFADYYFDALERYERGAPETAAVWRDVHDTCTCRDLHVLQHLLLGVNAHINYDLVLTLYDMLHGEWSSLEREEKERRLQDHLTVNEVIAETVDAVQDEVVERHDPTMQWVDRLLGRMDERILAALITTWRQDVWEQAQQMLACPSEAGRETLRLELAATVLRRARLIGVG